jgi:hypothetical protein
MASCLINESDVFNKKQFKYLSKTLTKKLLVSKKMAQETFLRSILQNEGRCWTEFYKYVKRRKGNKENIPAIQDHNGKLIRDPLEKANFLNSY